MRRYREDEDVRRNGVVSWLYSLTISCRDSDDDCQKHVCRERDLCEDESNLLGIDVGGIEAGRKEIESGRVHCHWGLTRQLP